MADYSPTCHPQHFYGLCDIKVAVPFNGSLVALGTATDQINISRRLFYADIQGDRNGGHQGPPIETQDLGEIWTVNMSLSSFNKTAIALLQTRAVRATNGVVLQSEVGLMILKEKSIRLLLDFPSASDTQNFWCAIVREPIQVGVGTKHSEWMLGFECHRPPCGHAKANIIWDRNNDAYA